MTIKAVLLLTQFVKKEDFFFFFTFENTQEMKQQMSLHLTSRITTVKLQGYSTAHKMCKQVISDSFLIYA